MRNLITALSVVVLFWPVAALADSDGYYCTGRGYLAYETRFSENPSKHLLHVVRFSRADGIAGAASIPLPDFQVHGMRCHATVVELEGWELGYSIDLSDPIRPTVTTRPTAFDPEQPARGGNLGHWAMAGVIDLEADGSPGEFQLVIARVSRPVEGGIEHYTFSELIRRDPRPGAAQILVSQKLFEGVFLETID